MPGAAHMTPNMATKQTHDPRPDTGHGVTRHRQQLIVLSCHHVVHGDVANAPRPDMHLTPLAAEVSNAAR